MVQGRPNVKLLHEFIKVSIYFNILNIKIAKHFISANSVFHLLRQAKFAFGCSIFSSSQFSPLPQLPQKMAFAIKGVKNDSKIIISLP
jgi:hypothetical protein